MAPLVALHGMLILIVLGYLPCVSSVALQQVQQPQATSVVGEATDSSIAAISDVINGEAPRLCSCDCCQAAQRLPSEVKVLKDGNLLEHKCVRGRRHLGESEEDELCPQFCTPTIKQPLIDSSRFCLSSCWPQFPVAGTACGFAEEAGGLLNTAGLPGWMRAGDGSGRSGAGSDAASQAYEAYAPYVEEFLRHTTPRPKQTDVKFDLQDLIAQRLRAEAGADMAHGAAVSARVRINAHLVGRNIEKIKKLKTALASVNTKLDENVAETKSSAEAAKEGAKKAAMLRKAAKGAFGQALQETSRLVAEKIAAQAADAVAEDANAYSLRMEWNRPKDLDTMMSNAAAVPYLQGLATSRERFTQYQDFATGQIDEAEALRRSAEGQQAQLEASERAGNELEAAKQKQRIQEEMSRSASLERSAPAYWRAADRIDHSVPQWQEAAGAASAYASAKHQAWLRDGQYHAEGPDPGIEQDGWGVNTPPALQHQQTADAS